MKFIQSKPFIFGAKEKIEHVGEGITRQLLGYDNNIMMAKVVFKQGAISYVHKHEHVQVSYIISGKFEVTIGDKVHVLQAGDSFYVESDIFHQCICIEEGELIDVFNPAREDFCTDLDFDGDFDD